MQESRSAWYGIVYYLIVKWWLHLAAFLLDAGNWERTEAGIIVPVFLVR